MRSEQLNHDEYDPSRRRTAKTKAELLVGKTGVGAGVTDLLNAKGLRFTPIMIHGGERVHIREGHLLRAQEGPCGGSRGAF
jgi:hypothetical protein